MQGGQLLSTSWKSSVRANLAKRHPRVFEIISDTQVKNAKKANLSVKAMSVLKQLDRKGLMEEKEKLSEELKSVNRKIKQCFHPVRVAIEIVVGAGIPISILGMISNPSSLTNYVGLAVCSFFTASYVREIVQLYEERGHLERAIGKIDAALSLSTSSGRRQ